MNAEPRSCEQLREAHELFALGILDAKEREQIEAHLARGCAPCRQALGDALALNAAVLSLATEVDPPRELRRRILAAAGYERPGWFWAGGLAALLMLVSALWLGVQERERSAQLAEARRDLMGVSGERDRLSQALGLLSDTETIPTRFGRDSQAPQGTVFANGRLGVLLIASSLPPAGEGKTYQLWLTPRDKAPRPGGLFQARDGITLHLLPGPVDVASLSVVSVTAEPASGSAAPTSSPVIAARLGQ